MKPLAYPDPYLEERRAARRARRRPLVRLAVAALLGFALAVALHR